jgi:hypothetical protein
MFSNEKLPDSEFTGIVEPGATTGSASGLVTFYRTSANANIELIIPKGTTDTALYTSADLFLPIGSFNGISKGGGLITFPNANSVQITNTGTALHDLTLYYKVTNSVNDKYTNNRSINVNLYNGTNVAYDTTSSINKQTASGDHVNILLKTSLTHTAMDIVKLGFNIVQTDAPPSDTDTKITIFGIQWVITSSA